MEEKQIEATVIATVYCRDKEWVLCTNCPHPEDLGEFLNSVFHKAKLYDAMVEKKSASIN